MALTGTFEADFSKFFDAVEQAKVSLRGFEQGAGAVDDKLSRMVDRFSGRNVIQQATLMTEAISRLEGGLESLTDAELARVGKTAGEAVEKMRALGMEVPKSMQDIADATKDAGTSSEGLGISVGKLAATYITAEAAIKLVEGAYHLLVGAMTAVIASAGEAEEADAALLAALHAQGTAVPSVVDAYDRYAAALQKTTIYSDDAVKAAEGVLAQVGGVMPRDMQRALEATTNLAAGLRIDLASAATMVAKAAEGQTTALVRAGVMIETTGGKTADFSTVLDTLNTKFAGAAEAAGDTFQGRLHQVANAWDNVQESVGRVITGNATLGAALDGISGILDTNTGELNDNADANNLVSDAVILAAHGAVLFVEGLDKLQSAAYDARIVMDGINQAVLNFGITVAEVAKGVQELNAKLPGIAGSLARERVQELTDYIDLLGSRLVASKADQEDSAAASERWSESLQGLQGQLEALAGKLEGTRGQTREQKTDVDELGVAWDGLTVNVKNHNDELAKAAEIAKQKAEADAVLASVDQDFHKTVAALDATMVESIKHYLEAGVAQDVLAKHYQLTAAQIAAVGKAHQEELVDAKAAAAYRATLAKLDLEYSKAVGAASHDTMQARIDDTYAWGNAEIAMLDKAHQYTADTYARVDAIVNQSVENIIQKTLEADVLTKAHYVKMAEDAEIAYGRTLTYADQYTNAATDALRAQRDAALEVLANWETAANAALEGTAGAAEGTARAVAHVTGEFGRAAEAAGRMQGAMSGTVGLNVQGAISQLFGQGAAVNMDQLRLMASGQLGALGGSGAGAGSLGQAQRNADTATARMLLQYLQGLPGRAAGGPVTGGHGYIVGERGPELFVPGASGMVQPGGGGTVIVQAGAVQINYPIANSPQALDALARTVGEAIVGRLTRTGARL